jgi:hypothetical protein
MNQEGDILVAHDTRISVIRFSTYWPFRDEKGALMTQVEIEPRDYLNTVKRSEINDSLFLNMKKRDDMTRGGGNSSKMKKSPSQTVPTSPTAKKQVRI